MREFETGGIRDDDKTFDPEGFISPRVLEAFSEYMEKHRRLKDGSLRASDNWQKGFPPEETRRSLTRHFLDFWLISRGYPPHSPDCGGVMDALCGLLFNTMVLMKNELDRKPAPKRPADFITGIGPVRVPGSTLTFD